MSLCRFCDGNILWMQRPTGGWFPPFDMPPEMESLEYEVHWSAASGDWVAAPIDQDIVAKLTPHGCEKGVELRRERVLGLQRDTRSLSTQIRDLGDGPLPDPPDQSIRASVQYVEVPVKVRPEPEWVIALAVKLATKCPTCGAKRFEWCTYKNDPETRTERLHIGRKGPG